MGSAGTDAERTKSPIRVSVDCVREGGGRMIEMGEGAQAKGCLKSHYELLSKFSIIIILMALISLQFGAMMF